MYVVKRDGRKEPIMFDKITARVRKLCYGFNELVDPVKVAMKVIEGLYDGVTTSELDSLAAETAASMTTVHPDYAQLAARISVSNLHKNTKKSFSETMADLYEYVNPRTEKKSPLLSDEVSKVIQDNAELLDSTIIYNRDFGYDYFGFKTLERSYLLKINGNVAERPQHMLMRVSVGIHPTDLDAAIETYHLMSKKYFTHATPTLFNSGTKRPQLSSCYLTTIPDDLDGIFSAMKDNALLSKWAGGLGNDWTPVRAMNSYIKGTNGKSQGVVPFLKVANDTAVAVNQGGKRKGAMCGYLETWHLDIEEFLDLRKNTGDERRRTHDMNTANWVPDLFMKRVEQDKNWTLFSPGEAPELHDLIGKAFEEKYEEYEEKAKNGEIDQFKSIPAKELWRKMLTMLFETGHPWITFKDSCNLRSPQQHAGVVHSSNLCTEITLNTSANNEIAVCNLGSVNLANHMNDGKLDEEKIKRTVSTAIRMLDNVININYYSVDTAKNSNLKHRPIGLGLMGFQDALYLQDIPYCSDEAVAFADKSMELISYNAIYASTELAKERGAYESFDGSLWSKGILPKDSLEILEENRGSEYLKVDKSETLDWDSLRKKVVKDGMRNSNVMAIAPTATISNITGVTQSIEPTYQNLYVKSNLSGEFTIVNPHLVRKLKDLDLWDDVMINDLKYFEGSLSEISRIPDDIKKLFSTAFEVEPRYIVESASRRQKWIDQAQSLNLYIGNADGKKLDITYRMAWYSGLKTTYYLRSIAATSTEKSTVQQGKLNAVSSDANQTSTQELGAPAPIPEACSLDDPDCEACQ